MNMLVRVLIANTICLTITVVGYRFIGIGAVLAIVIAISIWNIRGIRAINRIPCIHCGIKPCERIVEIESGPNGVTDKCCIHGCIMAEDGKGAYCDDCGWPRFVERK